VRAQRIEIGQDVEMENVTVVFVNRFLHPVEALIHFPEAEINMGEAGGRRVYFLGEFI
jgi:hypothetical protein